MPKWKKGDRVLQEAHQAVLGRKLRSIDQPEGGPRTMTLLLRSPRDTHQDYYLAYPIDISLSGIPGEETPPYGLTARIPGKDQIEKGSGKLPFRNRGKI